MRDFKHLKNVEISKYSNGLEVTKISTLALLKSDIDYLSAKHADDLDLIHESWFKPFESDFIDFDIMFKKTSTPDEITKYFNRLRSLRRTKNSIFEYGNENQFDTMVTITFSSKYDRENIELFRDLVNKGTKELKRKFSDFKYLLAPEYHPGTKEIHLHGVINGLPNSEFVRAINPKTNKPLLHNGRAVYNLPSFEHIGHTTAVRVTPTIENQQKVTNYIIKYITKDIEKSPVDDGDKRYWCSTKLKRPLKEEFYFTQNEIDNYLLDKKNAYVKVVDKSIKYVDKITGELIEKKFKNYYIVNNNSNNS